MRFFSILITVLLFTQPSFSYEVTCERISDSMRGFKSYSAMESIYPRETTFDAAEFSTKIGKKQVYITESLEGTNVTVTLLTNGKLTIKYSLYASRVAEGRYQCDSNALEVANFIQKGNAPLKSSNESNDYQAVWHCGGTSKDSFWTLNNKAELVKEEELAQDGSVEVYGLTEDNKIKLIRVQGEKVLSDEEVLAMASLIDQMEWVKRGSTFIGNAFITVSEMVLSLGFMINDEQSYGTALLLGDPNMVASVGAYPCQKIY